MTDFFSYSEAVPTQKEFAICDDNNQQPVSLEHVGDSEHQVIVISNNRSDYFFIAVDHNIPLKREDGSDDNICDAMLYTKETLCFIEIKCWRGTGWISKASNQIISTLKHFKINHPNDEHKFKDAYLCNWKQRRKLLNESHKELKSSFMREHKLHLYISNTINELV